MVLVFFFFLDYHSFLFYTCLDLDGLGWLLSDAVIFFFSNVSWLTVCVYVESYAMVCMSTMLMAISVRGVVARVYLYLSGFWLWI